MQCSFQFYTALATAGYIARAVYFLIIDSYFFISCFLQIILHVENKFMPAELTLTLFDKMV